MIGEIEARPFYLFTIYHLSTSQFPSVQSPCNQSPYSTLSSRFWKKHKVVKKSHAIIAIWCNWSFTHSNLQRSQSEKSQEKLSVMSYIHKSPAIVKNNWLSYFLQETFSSLMYSQLPFHNCPLQTMFCYLPIGQPQAVRGWVWKEEMSSSCSIWLIQPQIFLPVNIPVVYRSRVTVLTHAGFGSDTCPKRNKSYLGTKSISWIRQTAGITDQGTEQISWILLALMCREWWRIMKIWKQGDSQNPWHSVA